MTDKNQYFRVSRELLIRCLQNNEEAQPSQLYADITAILAAPPEDVRAVVGEPVGVIVIKKWLVENPASVSLKTNDLPNGAGLYLAPPADPELNAITLQLLRQAKDIPDGLYARAKALANDNRHPQRPMVLPERKTQRNAAPYGTYDYGWNACLDRIAEMNK